MVADEPGHRHLAFNIVAEFRDRATEARFRARSARYMARAASQALLVAGGFFLMFFYTDYSELGNGTTFRILLLVRGLFFGLTVGTAVYLAKYPLAATTGQVTSIVEGLGIAAFLIIATLQPGQIVWYGTSMIVIVTAIYLFVPNRFVLALSVSVLGSCGFALMPLMWPHYSATELIAAGVLIALTNVFGALACYRQNVLQRQAFRLMSLQRRANAKLRHEIMVRRSLQKELERAATTDGLTGLLNRGHFLKCANAELRRAWRRGAATSVLFLDVDEFKRINDYWGHACGDIALQRVARVCELALRDGDLIGRLGGEEFAMLLPDTGLAGAVDVAERLRDTLERSPLQLKSGQNIALTATIGVACCESEEILDALNVADMVMYQGKYSGGNATITALRGNDMVQAKVML